MICYFLTTVVIIFHQALCQTTITTAYSLRIYFVPAIINIPPFCRFAARDSMIC